MHFHLTSLVCREWKYHPNFTIDLLLLCTQIHDLTLDLFLSMQQATEQQTAFGHLNAFVHLQSGSSTV